ncbi:MAG: hypothetical protein ACI89J_003878 [Hyphomicrobiaceae bacterium]|jgi:hypothetical protein
MYDFHVGQQVVCVNDDLPPSACELAKVLPKRDEVYNIRGINDLGCEIASNNDPTLNRMQRVVSIA